MSRPSTIRDKLFAELTYQVVNSFKPGERLPSERTLAAAHGVSQRTVHRALVSLSRQGLIVVESSRGWKRTGETATFAGSTGPLRVGLITRRTLEEIERLNIELYPALAAEAKRQGIELDWFENTARLRLALARGRIDFDRVPWNRLDAALLLEVEDAQSLSNPLLKRHPVLVVDRNFTRIGLASVSFDDYAVGEAAARHLYDLGHRRLAVMEEVTEPGCLAELTWMERRHGFERTIGSLGGCIRPGWRLSYLRRAQQSKKLAALEQWAEDLVRLQPKDRPTALFAVSWPPEMNELSRHLDRLKVRIPRDLSLVTVHWSVSPPRPSADLPTRIQLDLAAMARRTFEAVRDLVARGPARLTPTASLYVAPMRLLPGNSTAAPRN